MSEEKLNTIIFKARSILVEMMEKIKEKRGLQSNTDVLRLAVYELYNQHYKEYGKDNLINATSVKSPAKSKEQKKEEKAHSVCMALNGEVTSDGRGNKSCIYKIYEKVNPKLVNIFSQTLPFDLLSEDNISRQYSPSKDEVIQVLEEQND